MFFRLYQQASCPPSWPTVRANSTLYLKSTEELDEGTDLNGQRLNIEGRGKGKV